MRLFCILIALIVFTACTSTAPIVDSIHIPSSPQTSPPTEDFVPLSLEVRPCIYHQTVSSNMAIQTDGSVWSLGQTPAEKIKESAVAVSDNPHASFILLEDGTLWGMGLNTWGEVGDSTFEDKDEPVLILENVRMVDGSAALLNDGNLYRWGHHRLMYRNGVNDLNPERDATPYPVKALDNVVYFVQDGLTVFAIQEDGSLWGWGHNGRGELGLGHARDIPVGEPVRIRDDVQRVWVGSGERTYMLDYENTLWGTGGRYWRRGNYIFVPILENVVDFGMGSFHSVAVTSDGRLWTWGENLRGQLGIGKGVTEFAYAPVYVMDQVVRVYVGNSETVAIREDGSMWVWGGAGVGSLLRGFERDYINSDIPFKVTDNVHSVYIGGGMHILKNDGTLWRWGYDEAIGGAHEPVLIMENVRLPY